MINRAWPSVRLGQHCSKIGSGATPHGGESVYRDEGVALIRSQNVYNGKFTTEGLARLSDEHAEQLRSVTVEAGDILLNITGDSVARSCRVPDCAIPARVNQHVAIIRPNVEDFDVRFLGYYLISPFMQQTMLSLAGSGGTRKALTKEMIERFDIPRPPRSVQERIADILAAYDDLIENNTRRIKLLEDAERLLYEEWFIRLRFPGHEHTRTANGMPRGWARKNMEEIAEFRLGKMLDEKKNRGEPMPYLANVNVRWGRFELEDLREMRFEDRELDTFGLRYGDIVMCEGGEPGRCAIWKEQLPRIMIQKAIHRIRPREHIDGLYLYHSLRHKAQHGHLASLFTGATIKHLPREKLAQVMIVVPPKHLMNQFSECVAPIERQTGVLQDMNGRLTKARDLLLPRLMSGEVVV